MIKLKVNTARTYLPLNRAKGTPQTRLQKAIQLNDQFFENIKGLFAYGDVSRNIFGQVLKNTTGSKVQVSVEESLNNSGKLAVYINKNYKINGYTLFLPVNFISKKISKMSTKTFIHETFHFFDRILNPKYTRREVSIFNKKYDDFGDEIQKFYHSNLYTKKSLNPSALNKLLNGKKAEEQIDILQMYRYNLMLEYNAFKYTKNYQRKMENLYKASLNYRETPYKYKEFEFPQKIKILEEKLTSIIQEERAKNKTLVL